MAKVFQVSHKYTETFCSPYPSEWEIRTKVLLTTLDESFATESCAAYNAATSNRFEHAEVKSYDLAER